ncbi:MAG: hypothetical protein P1U34_08525 [Coxiellaceae bacterium]|nr:hypothetical protein [Coxiellaceae bacterium]
MRSSKKRKATSRPDNIGTDDLKNGVSDNGRVSRSDGKPKSRISGRKRNVIKTEVLRSESEKLKREILNLVTELNRLFPGANPDYSTYATQIECMHDEMKVKVENSVAEFRKYQHAVCEKMLPSKKPAETTKIKSRFNSKIYYRKVAATLAGETKFNGYLSDEMQKLLNLEKQLLNADDSVKRRRIDPGVLSEIKAFNDAPFDVDALARLDAEIGAANSDIFSPAVIGGLFASPASAPAPSGDTYDAVFGPYGLYGPKV